MYRHLRAILLLPTVVTLVVPAAILYLNDRSLRPGSRPFLFAAVPFILTSLGLMVQTIGLFARDGQGTLAPWDPTRQLVVQGFYRHARNPMISGVFSILLGEALLFDSRPLFIWLAVFTLVNALYIPLLEEPALERRFGAAYRAYKAHVPRWLPRWKGWRGR